MRYSYDRRASTTLTPEYVGQLISKLDPALVYEAKIRLEKLQKDLQYERVSPFPVTEIGDYLRDWGVDEDEIQHVESIKLRAPRQKRKQKTFHDAYLALGKVLGVSVMFEGQLEHDPNAVEAIEAWAKGFRKMKPKARGLFGQLVKKVKLRAPVGSEDASWLPGGTMALSLGKPVSPASAASYLTHELGHAVEEARNVGGWDPPWGQPPFVSDYAKMRPNIEDFAESFRVFIERPSELRKVAPEKYEALKGLV